MKKIPLSQLSIEDRISAKQSGIVLNDRYPYPPFKMEYVFESDLKKVK